MNDEILKEGMTVEEVAEWQMSLAEDFRDMLREDGIEGIV